MNWSNDRHSPSTTSSSHLHWLPEAETTVEYSEANIPPLDNSVDEPVEQQNAGGDATKEKPAGRQVIVKVRIVDLDHFMVSPGPLDLHLCQFLPSHIPVLKVPVVRIYGANEAGQKTCLHVHQAYPYFYVPYEGSLEPAHLQGYIHQLGMSLNRAAAITFNAPQDLRRSQYVAAITPIKGVPFYGYHIGYSYFLKIYLFNPDFENRIVELMRSGAIMGTHFQPFEAHVPFKLQFFIDFNLYGMGWIELEDALIRNTIPDPEEGDHPKRLTKATVGDSRVWSREIDPGRVSHCEIEMDTTVDRIVNRDKAPERNIHNSLAECFQVPSGTAQVPSMASLWEDDARRRKANGLPSQEAPKTQTRNPECLPWLNHDLNKRMVAELVQQMIAEQMKSQMPTPTQGDFDNFPLQEDPLAASFKTAYQSVDFLCPRLPSTPEDAEESVPQLAADTSFVFEDDDSSILVDESIISQTATVLETEKLGEKRQLFRGLSGLGGIEEQDDEDDEFPMPDIEDDFLEGDLLDDDQDVALWGVTPHAERHGSVSDEGFADDELNIPQFDGGGDGHRDNTQERKRTASDEWNKASSFVHKRRTGTLNVTAGGSRASFGTVERATSSGSGHVVQQQQHQHQQPTSVSAITPKHPQAPATSTRKSMNRSVSARKLQLSLSTTGKQERPQRATSPPARREVLESVTIPPYVRRTAGRAKTVPAAVLNSSTLDDPILVDDQDGDEEVRKVVTPGRIKRSKRQIIAPVQDTEIEEISQYSDDGEPAITLHASQSVSPKPIKLQYDYPEPISPDREYFLKEMDEMWSSPSPPLLRPAFKYSPPRPTSPDLVPAHGIEPHWERERRFSKQSVTSIASTMGAENGVPTSTERRHSTIVERSVLLESLSNDTLDAIHHEEANFGKSMDVSEIIMAEDSIIAEQMQYTPEQEAPSQPHKSAQAQEQSPPHDSVLELLSEPMFVSNGRPCGTFKFHFQAPTTHELLSTFALEDLPNFVHQKPYYSVEADVPARVKVFGGKEFRVQSKALKTMGPFNSIFDRKRIAIPGAGFRFWEPIARPPSRAEVTGWLKEDRERIQASLRSKAELSTQKRKELISQIEGPTQKNPFGCKNSPTKVAGSIAIEKDYIDILSLELHCRTRGSLLPDPKEDPILAVFYCWQTDRENLRSNGWVPGYRVGVITHENSGMNAKLNNLHIGNDLHVLSNEEEMLNAVIDMVAAVDPDILAGFEVHNLSWGYMVDRYQRLFGMDMSKLLSRVKSPKPPVLSKSAMEARDSYNSKHNSGLKFTGRHLFNVWRLIRGEVALTNYGFCNVVFHVLQQRVPHYTHETLTKWWSDGHALHQSRVIKNYLHRCQYTLQLIESQELVSRTSEFARVFGVDFFSVISRGSQYKVESMMIRLAKPENFLMVSPSRAQVGGQRALEVIPMVMEPESGFYEDPVVVLDFQSLYPSMVIAYNYCYSTCLGKLGGGTKLGVTEFHLREGILPLVQNHLQVAPNHVMYVNQEVRRSLLSRMLAEILDTRVMVKKAMKEYPDNKSLLKLLESRQLSLKFVANVTYGYTSASYSGRMPGVEIADSIVASGRETLERAIRFVNENPKWNARVVYGDTDSMFVQLKGRTRAEAFEIGYDISETITRMNPRPVKLKFEKVYHPCFLVTKKRYVGASFETPNQEEPIFDAKGIETIRRDGIPAVQKIMETCIKTMFRTQDLSQVKAYFVRQLGKILDDRVPVPDLMFGKEVRMGGYSEKGVPPPGAVVSARRMELDPRAEPQYGERVPYIVVYGDPGARLTDQVVEPKELLRNRHLRLNAEYYIRKHVIPSLERIFQLAGADVKSWFDEMPRVHRASALVRVGGGSGGAGSADPAATVVPTETSAATIAAAEQFRQPFNADTTKESAAGMSGVGSTGTTASVTSEALLGPPKFKPKRKGGRGQVSLGSRIDSYYQSRMCVVCNKLMTVNHQKKSPSLTCSELCADCLSGQGRPQSILVLQSRLNKAEKLFKATVDVCSSCCRASPMGGAGMGDGTPWTAARMMQQQQGPADRVPDNTTGTELVACESIECAVFWQRRRAQDAFSMTKTQTDRILEELEALDLSF